MCNTCEILRSGLSLLFIKVIQHYVTCYKSDPVPRSIINKIERTINKGRLDYSTFSFILIYWCDIYLPSYKEWNCYGCFKAVTVSLNKSIYNHTSTTLTKFHTEFYQYIYFHNVQNISLRLCHLCIFWHVWRLVDHWGEKDVSDAFWPCHSLSCFTDSTTSLWVYVQHVWSTRILGDW